MAQVQQISKEDNNIKRTSDLANIGHPQINDQTKVVKRKYIFFI